MLPRESRPVSASVENVQVITQGEVLVGKCRPSQRTEQAGQRTPAKADGPRLSGQLTEAPKVAEGVLVDHAHEAEHLQQRILEQMTRESVASNGRKTPRLIESLYDFVSRMRHGRKNFSESSWCHYFRRFDSVITRIWRFRSAQRCATTRPASIVFPRPTSSARSAPWAWLMTNRAGQAFVHGRVAAEAVFEKAEYAVSPSTALTR